VVNKMLTKKANNILRARFATTFDLTKINQLVELSLMSWDLKPRVNRLILPIFLYDRDKLNSLFASVVEIDDQLIGLVCCANVQSLEPSCAINNLYLEGIFVHPLYHRQGVGSRLMKEAITLAQDSGCLSIQLRAKRESTEFFKALGFKLIHTEQPNQDYPYRFRLNISSDA
jgi:GNAT superfamily N-acetyltransferase